MISTVGNLNGRSRNNGLIKSWWTHTPSKRTHTHTHTKESHPTQNACADSDTLSFTQIPAVCGAQSEVLGAGTGPCRLFVPQSHHIHLKTHSLLRTSALPRRKTATHKGSQLRTTHACVWGYIGACLCPCHGKTITPAHMRPVCLLWYDVTEEGPCDQFTGKSLRAVRTKGWECPSVLGLSHYFKQLGI